MPHVFMPIEDTHDSKVFDRVEITQEQKNVLDTFRNYLYLNGYPPTSREVGTILGMDAAKIEKHYFALTASGCMKFDGEKGGIPTLTKFMHGLTRMQFKGEVTRSGIKQTRETLVNFYDLINTPDFVTYRVMIDLKWPYYKIGDYIIVCHNSQYDEDAVLLCMLDHGPMIGRLKYRTHDFVIEDFESGFSLTAKSLDIVGEIIGSVRMELPYEKLYVKSRVKIVSQNEFELRNGDVLKRLEGK